MGDNYDCDYLVIGGGAAGCILARRLAENPAHRVILLEAGKSDEGDPRATDLSGLDATHGLQPRAHARRLRQP